MSSIAPLAGYSMLLPSLLSQQGPKSSAAMASGKPGDDASSTNDAAGLDSVTSGGLRAQIKINGVVVGAVYNNGVTVMNNGYAMPQNFGGSDEAQLQGPQLADYRLAKLQKALQGSGAQFVMLPTAMTPDEWFATPGRHIDQTA